MRISVIMPCHNAAPWISSALRSVAQQTYAADEIIVIDDASTDDSLAQIERSSVPVKLVRINQRNAAAARNAGIEVAKGDWIALLDADDKWYPNHLARAVELLSEANDVAFMANHDWIGLEDELLPLPKEFCCKLTAPRSGMDIEQYFRLHENGFHFGHSTVLYRLDRVRAVGMFDPSQRRRHDSDLWIRMIADQTWTYDTVKSVGYRENTPGSLSKHETECDYFYLRSLVKNHDRVRSPFYRKHLAREARRAMGISFINGPREHYARIRELSWPHLSPMYKFLYGCATVLPGPIRGLIKAKRCIVMGPSKAAQKRSLAEAVAAGGEAAVAGVLAWVLFLPRRRAYRRLLNYDPRQNCIAGFAGPTVEMVPVRCDNHGFFLPELRPGAASGVLELDVRASVTGGIFDPVVEIAAEGFRDAQFLERGVRGVRFLNVSRLLAANNRAEGWVRLRGRNLAWHPESARLHVCREKVSPDDRVLVVAPHPDDAEIAAFGLYADTDSTVVTLTAGDASDRYSGYNAQSIGLPRATVAKIRVWDSITVPQFGDLEPEHAINLCFPDGRLREMHSHPDQDYSRESRNELDFVGLRRLNRSPLARAAASCTWKSMVRDLVHVVTETKPTIVVTPHPWLDSNLDHRYATAAVCEAIESAGLTTGRMYFYCVHNLRSELWPFGPAGTGVALPSLIADDGACRAGFYSHPLSADRQRDKFLALEAMHDIRSIEWPTAAPLNIAIRRVCEDLRGLAHGMGRSPTSYLRRALRPDEVFFVASFADAIESVRCLVGDTGSHSC
jgi:glycosyltransferase involved in cell wall biosynthesis/LmbE family N-acetylglucosaminyl deacetylase